MHKKFQDYILNEYKNSNCDIHSFFYEDKKYWLKKARATKSSFSHKFYYKLFNLELITPVEEKSAKEALNFECNKLEKFKSLSINVPNVIFKNEDFFVLDDSGKSINSFIRKKDAKQSIIDFYINESIDAISEIHNKKQYHGGAQARNLTFKNNKVYVIDLEDSFDDSIDLKTLQFRDFLLFLLSLTKIRAKVEINYIKIIDKYIENTKNYDFKNRLQKLASKFSFLIKLSKNKFIKKILGNDVILFFKLFDILYNLQETDK
ncbi:kinase [Arcobacter sp. CECT 8985]|uniref:kinase n=1 Tax=Arcobacter sp. CECT 8985 TaxID=1935424 RepID=UPI00100B4175|nr:kinase [Arcobacter sp. CECT 8985]RXJ87159.1 kinase [Arcobacter sp. CECT 8985]